MKLHAFAITSLLAIAAPAYASTKIISYVETNGAESSDPVVNFTSGQIARQDANGAINHAVTGIGTNKIYSKGNGTSELNAGSAWMDSYTVQGSGTVNVSLKFTVDGKSAVGANAGGDGNPFDWTYRVLALKGDDWTLGGQGVTLSAPNSNLPIRSPGDTYESMLLTRAAPGNPAVTDTFQPRFGTSTIWSVKDFGTDAASFASGFQRSGSTVRIYSFDNTGRAITTIYQPNALRIIDYNTGDLISFQPYTAANGLASVYQNLLAKYPILAQTGLCTLDDMGFCPGTETYDPTTLTLNFTLEAGEKFSVLSYLSHINLRDGEFDFYNTAKLTGISVSTGASLTSASNALQLNGDGTYGYAPLAIAGVPEPASWALMIGGFAAVGGMARRRQRQAANAASNAVATPRVA